MTIEEAIATETRRYVEACRSAAVTRTPEFVAHCGEALCATLEARDTRLAHIRFRAIARLRRHQLTQHEALKHAVGV